MVDDPTMQPPVPAHPGEAERVEHTRLRRRMLYGRWAPDLYRRMLKSLGNVRSDAIGEPDGSANPFEATCTGAAALYDRIPRAHQADASSRDAMRQWTERAMLWPMMSRVQRDTIGLREMLVRASVSMQAGQVHVSYEPVWPDMVQMRPDPRDPLRPIEVREWVDLPDPSNPDRKIWTQHEWSIDGIPRHRVLDAEGRIDLSRFYGLPEGGLVGDAYPAIRGDGRAVLPYATYHAAITGRLLDPFHRAELVEGNLNVGVLWTFFTHCIRSASWPQRWISGGRIASTIEGAIRRVIADPATILEILQDPHFDGQVTAGQWGSASDPKAVAEAIEIYERRFMGYVEIGSDFWRGSSDPRSGIALSLDRTGRIEAQRRYAPIFAPVDAELLSITATMINRLVRSPLVAEDGWRVEYVSLPAPIEQRRADREETMALLERNLISRAEARARIMGEDPTDAELALPETAEQPLVGLATGVTEIVRAVAAREIPRDAAAAMIARIYSIDPAEAEVLLGTAGTTFEPRPDAA